MDLALNNLQRLICHKTQTNKIKMRINARISNLEKMYFVKSSVFVLQLVFVIKRKVESEAFHLGINCNEIG